MDLSLDRRQQNVHVAQTCLVPHPPSCLQSEALVNPLLQWELKSPICLCSVTKERLSRAPLDCAFRDLKNQWWMMPLWRRHIGGALVLGHNIGREAAGENLTPNPLGVFVKSFWLHGVWGRSHFASRKGLIFFTLKQILWPLLRSIYNFKISREQIRYPMSP